MVTNAAIGAYPRLADALESLSAGRPQEAAGRVIAHLRRHPNEPRGLALLGKIALELGAMTQAEQFLRQAIGAGLDDVELHKNLASSLRQQERLPEALDIFRALEQRTKDPSFTAVIASILEKIGRRSEAKEVYENLIQNHPMTVSHWVAYGHFLRASARTEEAIAAYRRATEIDAERGEAWWSLADIKSKVLTDDDLAAMEKSLGIAVDERNIAPLHFALGRGWHDRENYERAFHHYAQGNRVRAEGINYVANELTEEIDESIALFGPSFFGSNETAPEGCPTPIFVVSLPRSGSTLLEQMLGNHSSIEATDELTYIQTLIRLLVERRTKIGKMSLPRAIHSLTPAEKSELGQEYLRRANWHRRTDAPYFIDKLPHNWSNIAFIRQILPHARFIDVRRSAMDCCFSNYTQSFSKAHAASFSMEDIGRCYADYIRYMKHLDVVAPGLVHHVRYEQLIENPEAQLRAVFDYLSLPWEDASLRFHESEGIIRTPSAEQVRQPLNRKGIRAWAPYSEWLEPLRKALGPLADA